MKNIEQFEHDPPLRATRTFEAFARHGSVTLASQELDITPSAVSHQLQLLEAFVQTPLTYRQGRRLVLTDEGRDYYRSISAAFSVLRSATGVVRSRTALRQISISLIPMFGIAWFIPRLSRFLEANVDVDVNVLYANHRNYFSDAADISIRFGAGEWQGYQSTRLLSGRMVPYCSEGFLAKHGPIDHPAALINLPLVHDEDRTTWVNWMNQVGIAHVHRATGPLFEDGQLAMNAAEAGLGVALLREPLVRLARENGSLIRLFDIALDDGRDYYLCRRSDTELPDGAHRLAQWIATEMEIDQRVMARAEQSASSSTMSDD